MALIFSENDILANTFDAKLSVVNESNLDTVFDTTLTVRDVNIYCCILSEILRSNGQVYMYFNKPSFGKFYGEYYEKSIYELMGDVFYLRHGALEKHEEFLKELNNGKIAHFNKERDFDYDVLECYGQAKEIFSVFIKEEPSQLFNETNDYEVDRKLGL